MSLQERLKEVLSQPHAKGDIDPAVASTMLIAYRSLLKEAYDDMTKQWQPIYTVPRDRKVLVTDGNGEYWAAKFTHEDEDTGKLYFQMFHGDYCSGPEDPVMWRELDEITVPHEEAQAILGDAA